MTERYELRVPGVAGGRGSFDEVRSPYSGEVLAEVEQGDGEALDVALTTATRLFRNRDGWLAPWQRIEVLKGAAEIMGERREHLARQIALEGGKPLTDALVEVDRAINGVELCAEEAARVHGTEIPMGATAASVGRIAFTTREPIGVVAAVSAFNHPLNLIVHQVAPAIAAGCPVVVKPAGPTPLSCIEFVSILHEAGLPPEWCVAFPCSNEVAEQLVTSDRIAFFTFIGSARVGWMLRSKLAPGVRCALEHGGAAPMIVDETADLDRAVPLVLKGGYYHAGQVCVSVQRVFTHRAVYDEVVRRLADGVRALRVGDPLLPDTEVGPLIRQGEVDRVASWVEEAAGAGADVVVGGKALEHQCFEPTLLAGTPDDVKCMSQEIFGPVVNVVPFDDFDEAIIRANALPYAFQAAIATKDVDRALRAGRCLDATAVMVNDHTAFRVDWMPFGGRNQSGLGMGGMPFTMEDVTRLKMLVFKEG